MNSAEQWVWSQLVAVGDGGIDEDTDMLDQARRSPREVQMGINFDAQGYQK
jgi:hypothetical protein